MWWKILSSTVIGATFCTLAQASQQYIYGLHEQVRLPEIGIALPAKLDTGAITASMHALDIEIFQQGNQHWVRFLVPVDGQKKRLELPIVRMSQIKRRADDISKNDKRLYTQRPVVEMTLCMGNRTHRVEVNLTDRSTFEYPLLIGSSALKTFGALVDPAQSFSSGVPDCA